MSVVTTNVKVTDLGSKEADEVEVETYVWKKQEDERREMPIYALLQTNHSYLPCCGAFIKHSKLAPGGVQPHDSVCLCSRPD